MQHNNTNNTKIWPLSNNITVPKLYPFIQFIQPLGLPKCSYWRPESGLVDKEQACKMLQRNLQPGSFMAVKIFMERFYPRPRVTLLVQLIFSKLTFSTNLKYKKPTNTHFLFGWNWSGKDFCICGCQVRCAPLLCSSCQVNPSPAFPLLSLLAPQPKRGEPGSRIIEHWGIFASLWRGRCCDKPFKNLTIFTDVCNQDLDIDRREGRQNKMGDTKTKAQNLSLLELGRSISRVTR